MEAISTTFTDADLQIGSRRRQTLVRNDLGRGCRSGGYVSGHPPRPRSVTQSLLTVYPNRRIDHTGSPVILRPQGRYTCNLRAAGLPPIRPASRVPSGPALVRSLSIALSNSAKAPSIRIIIRPAVVVVSMPSVKLRNPAPVYPSLSIIVSTSRSDQDSRSSFQATSTSPRYEQSSISVPSIVP